LLGSITSGQEILPATWAIDGARIADDESVDGVGGKLYNPTYRAAGQSTKQESYGYEE
jgi:hypothetical protein